MGLNIISKTALVVCLFLAGSLITVSASIPYLKKNGNVTQLMVNEKPFIMLAAELHNSSSSGHEYMQGVWPTLQKYNVNTVLANLNWELFEPVEGQFDYSYVDSLVYNARKQNLKLVLLWFGTWKNGVSDYAPIWMKKDSKRFFRAKNESLQSMTAISPFCDEARKSDIKAFSAFMHYLKKIDSTENTVILVQVQNEQGLFAARDYNDICTRIYESEVPKALLSYMNSKKGKNFLNPYLENVWAKYGYKTKGTWPQVFGYTTKSFEFLMAWQYASYTNAVAAEGKKQYPLPMYVNAWLVNNPTDLPGVYPCGGPVPRVMDIYKVAAPSIDFLSPDIYRTQIKDIYKEYHRADNPLFIPEHRNNPDQSAAAAVFAIGGHNALGFAPFGIESMEDSTKIFTNTYEMLKVLSPEIVKYQGTGKMVAIHNQPQDNQTSIDINIEGYNFHILYISQDKPVYGLIIKTGEDEFIMAGTGIEIKYSKSKHDNGKLIGVGQVREMRIKNGQLHDYRFFNGDEIGWGTNFKTFEYVPSKERRPLIVKVKTYLYE